MVLAVLDVADEVVEDAHLDARVRAVDQDVDELAREPVTLPDEVRDVDGVARFGELPLELGELLGAAGHDPDVVCRKRESGLPRLGDADDFVEAEILGSHFACGDLLGVACLEALVDRTPRVGHLQPPSALERLLPEVATEEEVHHQADDRQNVDQQEPGEGLGGIALVVDQHDGDHDRVDEERQWHQGSGRGHR